MLVHKLQAQPTCNSDAKQFRRYPGPIMIVRGGVQPSIGPRSTSELQVRFLVQPRSRVAQSRIELTSIDGFGKCLL